MKYTYMYAKQSLTLYAIMELSILMKKTLVNINYIYKREMNN